MSHIAIDIPLISEFHGFPSKKKINHRNIHQYIFYAIVNTIFPMVIYELYYTNLPRQVKAGLFINLSTHALFILDVVSLTVYNAISEQWKWNKFFSTLSMTYYILYMFNLVGVYFCLSDWSLLWNLGLFGKVHLVWSIVNIVLINGSHHKNEYLGRLKKY